jgi:ectoine hydroxylase-related dioxygenase (phytanoyl-CoA dioxygenase family)|tara:strand:- start:1824 stop:2675 length:852 start_codon:yes stop_codon:yes gene_type:complete
MRLRINVVDQEHKMKLELDPNTLLQFQNEGATVLRGFFVDWVETLRDGIAANIANPNPNARIYQSDGGGGRFFVDYCSWQRIPQYRDFIFNSLAAEIGANLMNSKKVQLFHEHILVKEAQTSLATPWHHDMPYYCVDGPKTVSLWIPLDEVPRKRTLEFVSGSHQWGKSYRPQRFNGQPLNESDALEDIPDISANRDDYNIIGWDLMPGDAVAFDYRTLHGAPANHSTSSQRRAFSLRLVGDDARFVRKQDIVTSPPFNQVTLQHGDPLKGDEFPLLYQSQYD